MVRTGGFIAVALLSDVRQRKIDAAARPYWWGLAADGARGVSAVIDVLRNELDMAMALSGRPTFESFAGSLLVPDE